VANAFAAVPVLGALHARRPGLRVPRGYDAFETAVCAILGQLVSVQFARVLAGQVVAVAGEPMVHPVTGEKVKLFPTPRALARADLSGVGTTGARKRALQHFAAAVDAGELSLSDAQDPAQFRKALLAIPGIGPWTAEYIALRCIADTDAFPATDLILQRALEANPGLRVDACKPWRAYAAIHLWEEFAGKLTKTRKRTSTKEVP
jgi:3-methyladenine DNA glycosylase/8-oxoguanine DNA glycosylase